MEIRLRRELGVYLALVLAQLAHSLEEYLAGFCLWMAGVASALGEEVAAVPLVTHSPVGFLSVNAGIVLCLAGLVPFLLAGKAWARRAARLVAAPELANGTGHMAAAWFLGRYFPGCLTGVGLVATALLALRAPVSKMKGAEA